MQKGFAFLPLILLVLIGLGGASYYFATNKQELPPLPIVKNQANSLLNPVKSIDNLNTYTNEQLGFEFKHPNDLMVKEDSEEEFNKRGKGEFKKNFTKFVGYEPGKFLGAVVALENDGDFNNAPLTVWVFENYDNLSIDDWYDKYWYFPFIWGDFTSNGKAKYAPIEESTISGKLAKGKIVDYSPGKPKFIYLSNNGKMYLIKVTSGNEKNTEILNSFKILTTDNNSLIVQIVPESETALKGVDEKYRPKKVNGSNNSITLNASNFGSDIQIPVNTYIFVDCNLGELSVNPTEGFLEPPPGIIHLPNNKCGLLKAIHEGTVKVSR